MKQGENTLMQIPGYFCTRDVWERMIELWGGKMNPIEFCYYGININDYGKEDIS